jgi:uncharacterized membrane protein YedE/YeeE
MEEVMKPTRPLTLLGVFVVALALSYGVMHLWDSLGTPPGVPGSAPVTVSLIAVVVLAIGLALRSRLVAQRELARDPAARLRGERVRPVDPIAAARAAVLAKAAAMVGALVVGAYLGYALVLIDDLSNPVRRSRAIVCGYAVAAGVALVVVALFLEHVLKVPPSDEGNQVPDTDDAQRGTSHP